MVYHALARTGADGWPAAHARHSRAIAPLVVVVYGMALLACAGVARTAPHALEVWLTSLATVAVILLTAVRLAPLHCRLGREGPRPELLQALIRTDRARTLLAALALGGALSFALR